MSNYKKLNHGLMSIALLVCTVITITTEYHIEFQPYLLKDIVCMLISFVCSLTLIVWLLEKIMLSIWNRMNKTYYLGGKWYVIYHGYRDTQSYIRVGTAELKQHMDEIKMKQMQMHSPSLVKDALVGFEGYSPLDTVEGHRPSIGDGEYTIDFENLSLKGFYNLHRIERNENISGLNILTIHKVTSPNSYPQYLSGNFYNAEKEREKKPTTGITVLYRNKEEAETYVKEKLKASGPSTEGA